MMKTGYFMDGLIPGLSYRTEGITMAVGADGSFSYPDGGHVTFLIGQTPIGTSRGKQNVTPLDFYMQACRSEPQYSDFCVFNTARILLAAAAKGADTVLALEKVWQALVLADEPEVFSRQKAVRPFLQDTGTALPSCSRTRNIMRRCENNIHLDRHVEIPLKDGRHVNANVYRPIQPGRYPVIMCMGAFGSAFINGFRTEENAELLEEVEDRFYSEPNRFETQRMAKGMDEPSVTIQMATGNGTYYVRKEADWPVPGTEYQKLYLAAGGRLLPMPQEDGYDAYRADVDYEKCADSGVTYTSDPVERDMEIAGNAMADLFAASSSDDMELHISVKVLLPDGRELLYQSPTQIDPRPVIVGALKASHRALDQELTRIDSPFYSCGAVEPCAASVDRRNAAA